MTPLLLYDTIYFHTSVPEVPQLPSENCIIQNPPALRITVAFLKKIEEETKYTTSPSLNCFKLSSPIEYNLFAYFTQSD